MARESKGAFKMAGYTYPGTTPMTNKIKQNKFDVDKLVEEEEEKEDSKEVEASLLGGLVGSIRNVGSKKRMKNRTK
tara:strand:+ start:320 stop:547 length:228 start_codon:yes stop_codon:yes gene_type:complete